MIRYYVITKNSDGTMKTVYQLPPEEWLRYAKGKTKLSKSELEFHALHGTNLNTPKELFFTFPGREYYAEVHKQFL